MAQRMAGKRVALAGPRKAEEMALLVVKMGVSQYSARPRVPFFWTISSCATLLYRG